MKTAFALLMSLTLATTVLATEVGKPAPDFTATDINGKTIHLSDYKGKIVVIESYNQDCPYCHNQYKTGAMQALQRELAAKGVVWLLVDSVNKNNFSYQTPDQAKADAAKEKMDVTAWIDDSSGTIGHLYDMKTTPDMYVINKDGILVYHGAIDNKPDPSHDPRTADNYVADAVNALMADKTVAVTETKPYGCSVKYAD
ncbi:MAG TPA: redoxin domain-containing protein [Candidatus Saccharimonadales bacterium]|nr:redoxin domain-containing protein [Candidatus Saccharimonadales bacterium]